jgi:hypothetical protein
MLFDDAATARVLELWARLDTAGIASMSTASHGRHRPHATLLNATTLSGSTALVETLQALVGADLFFDSLAIFPGPTSVLFLAACVTPPLLSTHSAVHELVSTDQTEPWPRYRPGSWVPHCTLAGGLNAQAVSKAFELLHPFRAIHAIIAEICAVDTETGHHASLGAV